MNKLPRLNTRHGYHISSRFLKVDQIDKRSFLIHVRIQPYSSLSKTEWTLNEAHPETKSFLRSELDKTQAKLHPRLLNQIRRLRKELRSYYPRHGLDGPKIEKGDYCYYEKQVNGYTVYCRQRITSYGEEEILLDTRTINEGYVKSCIPSPSHTHIAYLVHTMQGEQGTLYVKELSSARRASYFTSLLTSGKAAIKYENVFHFVWCPSGTRLYFTRLDDMLRSSEVYLCSVDCQFDPTLVYHERDSEFFVSIAVTSDNRYISVHSHSFETSEIRLIEPTVNPIYPQIVASREGGREYHVQSCDASRFLILARTDTESNFKLLAIPKRESLGFDQALTTWDALLNTKPLIEWDSNVRVDDVEFFGSSFICARIRRDTIQKIQVYYLPDMGMKEWIPIPGQYGCIDSSTFLEKSRELLIEYSTPFMVEGQLRYDLETAQLKSSTGSRAIGMNQSNYTIRTLQTNAHLNEPIIPITVIEPKSISEIKAPCILFAYGSYGVPNEANFQPEIISYLQKGCKVALAHIRGGGDLGPSWHFQARKANKCRSVDDLIRVCDHLVEQGLTDYAQLAGIGTSAGGFVFAAALNKRPDLFRALLLRVPFLDPLSAMTSSNEPLSQTEVSEWGDISANEEEYMALAALSPVQNVSRLFNNGHHAHTKVSILLTAGQYDERVRIWQPLSYVYAIRKLQQECQDLIRLDVWFQMYSRAHIHSGDERFDELAFETAFVLDALGLTGK